MGLCCASNHQSSRGDLQPPELIVKHSFMDCTVSLKRGNALVLQAEAIVATIDGSIHPQSRIGHYLRSIGSSKMIRELKDATLLGPNLQNGQVFVTKGVKNAFQQIIWCVIPKHSKAAFDMMMMSQGSILSQLTTENDHQYLFGSIQSILQSCLNLGIKSLVIPTFEDGKLGGSMTAMILLMAIKSFIEETNSHTRSLEHIDICCESEPMTREYFQTFNKIFLSKSKSQVNLTINSASGKPLLKDDDEEFDITQSQNDSL